MKPTVLMMVDGARRYVEMPPADIRRAIRGATRQGARTASLGGVPVPLARIAKVAGQPIEDVHFTHSMPGGKKK